MGFFDRAPRSKEQAGQMRLNMRIIACVVLGYFAVQMLQTPAEESGMSPFLKISVSVGFLLFAVIVGGMSLRDYYRLQKEAKKKALEDAGRAEEESADEADDDEVDDGDEDDSDDEDDEDWDEEDGDRTDDESDEDDEDDDDGENNQS